MKVYKHVVGANMIYLYNFLLNAFPYKMILCINLFASGFICTCFSKINCSLIVNKYCSWSSDETEINFVDETSQPNSFLACCSKKQHILIFSLTGWQSSCSLFFDDPDIDNTCNIIIIACDGFSILFIITPVCIMNPTSWESACQVNSTFVDLVLLKYTPTHTHSILSWIPYFRYSCSWLW